MEENSVGRRAPSPHLSQPFLRALWGSPHLGAGLDRERPGLPQKPGRRVPEPQILFTAPKDQHTQPPSIFQAWIQRVSKSQYLWPEGDHREPLDLKPLPPCSGKR